MKRPSSPGATAIGTLPGLVCLLLAGCVWMKSYPDPAVPAVTYAQLTRPSAPLRLRVSVEYRRNGVESGRGERALLHEVERILHASGLIEPTLGSTAGEIHVVLDNRTDAASGPPDEATQDIYVMAVQITTGDSTFAREDLRDSFFTIVGHGRAPPGIGTVTAGTALDKVIERLLLSALVDFQRSAGPSGRDTVRELPELPADRKLSR